jgi:DNA-binding SARP family transcriptional activator
MLAMVGVLGEVEAWSSAGERLILGPSRHRALLAALAVRANTAVSVEILVELLWAERPPATARQLVHTYMSRLRRIIDPAGSRRRDQIVMSSRAGYTLQLEDGVLDADRFNSLVTAADHAQRGDDTPRAYQLLTDAVRLWRGEPFAGLSSPLFDAERSALEERRFLAARTRLSHAIELGGHEAAVPELITLSAAHPLQEPVVELLMLALYRGGRQSEALGIYTETRTRLDDELGIEPSPSLQQLHLKILRADPVLDLARQPAVLTQGASVARSSGLRPAQLPRDIATFSGRHRLEDDLIAVLGSAGQWMPVCAVYGRAGVGKTALAVHLGHRIRVDFPDGQIFLNLGGARPSPVNPFEALDTIIRAIDPHVVDLPDSVEQRAARLRSITADRRLLLVLDDAGTAEQVYPLLPGGTGCAVIVTSRTPLADLDGARLVRLDSLDESSSLQLLRQAVGTERIGREPSAAAAIAAACAGLPLALQIVAGKLNARPHWPLQHAALALSDETARLDRLSSNDRAVRRSFALSIDQLGSAERRALAMLSLVDLQRIDAGAAAAALDLDIEDALELIETLVDYQVLDAVGHTPTGDLVVSYHDLVRLYARELAAAELSQVQRHEAIRRVMGRYLGLLCVAEDNLPFTADSIGDPAPVCVADSRLAGWIAANASEWLDAETTAVAALVRQGLGLKLDCLPWRILDKFVTYTVLRERWDIWLDLGPAALELARAQGDVLGQAVLLRSIGRIETDRSDGRPGMNHIRHACDLFQRLNHAKGRARTLKDMSHRAKVLGDGQDASRLAEEAIQLAEPIGDLACLADAHANIAAAALLQQDLVRSLTEASKSKRYLDELDKPGEIAALNMIIAECRHAQADRAAAAAALHESLAIVLHIKDRRGQACILRELGYLSLDGHHQDAVTYFRRSQQICRELGADRVQAQVLHGLAQAYRAVGRHADELDCAQQAWALIQRYPGVKYYDDIASAAGAQPTPPYGRAAQCTSQVSAAAHNRRRANGHSPH